MRSPIARATYDVSRGHFAHPVAPNSPMDATQRLRQTAWIRRGLMPTIWVVVILLLISVVINSLYLYRLLRAQDLPLVLPEGFPESVEPPTGGNGTRPIYEIMGPGPFPPCRGCFMYGPGGKQFLHSDSWFPECHKEEGLSPCEYENTNFWQCRIDPNGTKWAPNDIYNSSIMCHLLRPAQVPISGIRHTRHKRAKATPTSKEPTEREHTGPSDSVSADEVKRGWANSNMPVRPEEVPQCTSCMTGQGKNVFKFKLGLPQECNTFPETASLPDCTFGRDHPQVKICRGRAGVRNCTQVPLKPQVYKRCQGPTGIICYLPKSQGLDSCTPCMKKAWVGTRTIETLIYHTEAPSNCAPQAIRCTSNGTMYSYCLQGTDLVCYNPELPVRMNVSVWAGLSLTSQEHSWLYYLNSTVALKQGTQPLTVVFDVCAAMDKAVHITCGNSGWRRTYQSAHKYLCPRNLDPHKGNPDDFSPCENRMVCTGWDCVCKYTGQGTHSGCSHIVKFERIPGSNLVSIQVSRDHPPQVSYGIGIEGSGRDPVTYITIRLQTKNDGEIKSLGWSVYDNLRDLEKPLPLSAKAVNLFVEMAEVVAKSLTVKNCFVCGGTNMGEQWPWEALETSPEVYNNMSQDGNITRRTDPSGIVWTLTTNLVGRNCFVRNGSVPVGHLICLGTWDVNYTKWTSPSDLPAPPKLNSTFLPFISSDSEYPGPWVAPANMYWICGNTAYEVLPPYWSGSCILGWIKPSFFLLPIQKRQVLGVPLYEHIGLERKKRESGHAFSNFPCKELAQYEEQTFWDSERIVCTYGKATWAEDGSWGYRTPIYMLNRIIRLQAVLDLAGERIDQSLNILASTADKLRTAVYQNRLALDYLLAKEGGVCGKFNLTNCCLQIDETGSVIKQLTTEMRQLTHFEGQDWKGFDFSSAFGSWFPKLPGLQAIVALIGLIAAGCVILPCVLPIFVRTISNSLSLLVDKKASAKALALRDLEGEYTTLLQHDKEEPPLWCPWNDSRGISETPQ